MNNINKINTIIENLKTLTILDLNTLILEIEKSFNITYSNLNTSINNNSNIISTEVIQEIKEEKSSFNITLISVPQDKKISILKIVRNITNLGLKESKDIVDNVPKILKENISKDECENIKKEIESLGGTIKID